jgi:hypothetical protein
VLLAVAPLPDMGRAARVGIRALTVALANAQFPDLGFAVRPCMAPMTMRLIVQPFPDIGCAVLEPVFPHARVPHRLGRAAGWEGAGGGGEGGKEEGGGEGSGHGQSVGLKCPCRMGGARPWVKRAGDAGG